MRLDAKRLELFGSRFGACLIVATVEVSSDRQTGSRARGANEAQDLLIAVERFASPVLGDLREETMLNGIPFGSARRVVGNSERQTM